MPVLVTPTGKQQNSKDKRNRIDTDKKEAGMFFYF
jgi:hypothetical protein